MDSTLLIYAEKTTPRLRYIFKLIFKDILGCPIDFTNDIEAFKESEWPKINYSKQSLEEGLFVQSVALLFESDIFEQDIHLADYEGSKAFFSTSSNSALPFDPFAASFYLVSRYEEYLPHISDEHNRFPAQESLAYKGGFLHLPLVNRWAGKIRELMEEQYPQLYFSPPPYRFISTIDVDNSYAYLGKGGLRTVGAFIKDLFRLDFKEFQTRLRTILQLQQDPFDTYEEQFALQEQYDFPMIYFLLFARFGSFDRNLPMQSRILQLSAKNINDHTDIGIHPSYHSNSDPKVLEREVRSLSAVLNRDIRKSRQHYLKMTLPATYRKLIDLGIKDEYSMGYASEPGFRASICTPFRFYDLELEFETPLRVHPFAFMEVTFLDSKKMAPKEAWKEIETLLLEVKKWNGTFISIWHQRTFSEKEAAWKGWNQLYEKMVRSASELSTKEPS